LNCCEWLMGGAWCWDGGLFWVVAGWWLDVCFVICWWVAEGCLYVAMVCDDVWCVFDDWLMICCVLDGVDDDCVDDCCEWLMFDVGRFVR
jgi:hypothetical protein